MKKTNNYYYNKPDREDKVNIEHLNQNADNIDEDISGLKVTLGSKAPIESPKFSGEPMAPKPGEEHKLERICTMGVLEDALEVEVLE